MTKYRKVNNILFQRDQLTPKPVCRAKEGACYGVLLAAHIYPQSQERHRLHVTGGN